MPRVPDQPPLSCPPQAAQREAPAEKRQDLTSHTAPYADTVPPRAPQLTALIKKLRSQRWPRDKRRESPGSAPPSSQTCCVCPTCPGFRVQSPSSAPSHLEQEPPGMFMQLMERAQDAHTTARKKERGPPRVYLPWAWVQPQQGPLPDGMRPGTDCRERRG